MPLVRFAVKNEYGLGVEELYKDGVESEDPKAVLDGVAVAGLVGVLRQLGDLAQFAAEVFHGLQEQVASTSSRSRKLVNRVQRIEASLPSIEKAILSQTDHLRFAYTPGSEQHAYIRTERNLFICDDLPHFVMDSYEECREPPRLQLLDRFDSGGSGSCLKRYSDPTFFKRASSCSEVSNSEKSQRERKARKIKKRRSWQQSGQLPKPGSNMNGSSRMQFSSIGHGQSSLSHTGSTVDITFKSDLGDQSDSRGSKDGLDYIECVSRPSISTQREERKNNGVLKVYTNRSVYLDEENSTASGDKPCSHAVEETVHCSSSATWDELLETVEPRDVNYEIENTRQVPVTHSAPHEPEFVLVNEKGVNQVNDLSEQGSNQQLEAEVWHLRPTSDENTMKPTGLNFRINLGQTLKKTDFDLQEHHSEQPHLKSSPPVVDLSEVGKPLQLSIEGNLINDPVSRRLGTGDTQYFLEANFDFDEKKWEMINSEHACAVDAFTEGASNVRAIEWNSQEPETVEAEHLSQVDVSCEDGNNVNIIEWNELGSETVNSILVTQGDAFSEGGNNVKVIEWNRQELGTVTAEHVSEMDTFSEGGNSVKLISWNQQELESQNSENVSEIDTFTEGGNGEWNQIDDIDSGTENFVDALNSIESESESDFEAEMRKEVITTGSKDELGQNAVNGQTSKVTSHVEPENQSLPTSYNHEGGAENSERSTSSVSSANTWSPKDELGDNVVNGQISEITSHVEPRHQRLTTSYYLKEGPEDLERSTVSVSSVNIWSPKDELRENVVDGQTSETSNVQPKQQRLATSYDRKEGPEVLNRSTTPVSSTNMLSPGCTWSSYDKSESAAAQKMDASTCLSEEQSVQSNQSATLSNVPQGIDISVNDPVTSVESALCANAKAGFDALSDKKTICAPHMSQEVSVGSSTSDPVAFWTNGTLFGLAPSKPIVFDMPNSVDSAPTSNGDNGGQRSLDAIQKVNPVGKLSSSINKSEFDNESDDYGLDNGSSNHLSHQRLENTSIDHDKISSRNHPVMLDPSNSDAMPLESTVPVGTHVKNVSSEATSGSEKDRSSLLSVFSRGLLKNGLRRSGSLVYNETHESGDSLKTNKFDNICQNNISHSVPETNLKGKLSSPVHSPPPSPPLEHMKIAFQPVDGFDMSRLKLKYPEGVDQYENTLDAFPTFQLVPESTKLQHDIGSDSDDDTFCRSYACMSDESHSHMSDSNSDQWESGDSTESNDHALYSGLHRISSSKSASVSPQLEEADPGNIHISSGSISDVHSLSNPSFGLPTLDPCNPVGFQEMKLGLNRALDSSHLQEQTHEPPPLPPMQWRVSRLVFDEVEDYQYQGPDSLSQSFVPNISHSAIDQVDSAKLISTTQESPTGTIPQKVEVQKSGQEQTYHAEKEKGMDDKGDFLHQIRTKSFNLKRMEPSRSTCTPSSATSNKITAILQKANAIRQAVGSDDGEDDSWSDT